MNNIDVSLPALAPEMGGPQATLVHWLHTSGSELVAGMPLVIIATEQAEIVLPAPITGTLTDLLQPEGQIIHASQVLARIAPLQSGEGHAPPEAVVAQPAQRATPLARSIAARASIPLTAFEGTGDQGRITAHDVRAFLARMPTQHAPAINRPLTSSNTVQAYAGRLPICTAWMLCDASALQLLAHTSYRGIPISPLACLAAACSTALLRNPQAAQFWSEQGLLRRKRPLLQLLTAEKTVLLEHADDLNIYGIVRRIHSSEAKSGLPYTFSLCTYASSHTHLPVLAPALNLGPTHMRPDIADESGSPHIVMRPYAWLSFSYDARVLSFYQADRFLCVVIQLLEGLSRPDV